VIAVSGYFADIMKKKMNLPDEKMHVIPIGIEPAIYPCHRPAMGSES